MAFHSPKNIKKIFVALVLACVPHLVLAFTPFKIKEIKVIGLEGAQTSTILSYLPVSVGDEFTDALADQSIKSLYASGLFSDVSLSHKNGVLYIKVTQSPVISSITIQGASLISSKNLLTALKGLGFQEGVPFSPALLERVVTSLKQQYQSLGRYGIEVKTIRTPLPNNRVGINLEINEGVPAAIARIQYIGNKVFPDNILANLISETEPGFMTWYTNTDKYTPEKLQADVNTIHQFYVDRGYLDMTVHPQIAISPDRQHIYITFTIHEGARYKLSKVELTGHLLGLGNELQALVQVKAGEFANADQINATVTSITGRLGDFGYAFARVQPNTVPDKKNHTVALTFVVEPGQRTYVNKIIIGGNTSTRDVVIRRAIVQLEGAWYNAEAIRQSEINLNRLGYFGNVRITQQAVPGTTDQVNLIVTVQERRLGSFNFNVGYGSSNKINVNASVSQRNIFGSGTDLSVQFSWSKRTRSVSLTQVNPYFTSSGVSRTFSISRSVSFPYETLSGTGSNYKTVTFSTGLAFGIPISVNDSISVSGTFESNRIELPPQGSGANIPFAYYQFTKTCPSDPRYQAFCNNALGYGVKTKSFVLGLGWSKDTRDNYIAPSSGYFIGTNASLSVGNLRYYQLSASGQYYIPLGKDFTLAFNAGYIYNHNLAKGKAFPVIKDVYAGGLGSLRGYQSGSLGPRGFTGNYLGGQTKTYANAQLYLPFPGTHHDRTLRWYAFTDAARIGVTGKATCKPNAALLNADPAMANVDPCGWRYSVGIGLSWQSPIGPLQFSYAWPINPQHGDAIENFQFQIGAGF